MNSTASDESFRFDPQGSSVGYAWYWSPEWQAWESEADEDWEAGRYEVFDSLDGFIDSLDVS